MAQIIVNPSGRTREISPVSVSKFNPPEEPSGLPEWRDQVQEALRRQEYREETDVSQRFEMSIETPAQSWIAVVGSGDWHVGAEGTDHAKWQYDMQIVLDEPDMKLLLVGDESDMFTWNPGAFEQVFNPQEQMTLVNGFMKEALATDSVLARVGGNHCTEWLMRNAGLEYATVMWGFNNYVPYLREGGLIHWKVGDVVYDMLAHHRSRYNSSLNMFHANRRRFRMEGPADFVWSAHTHELGSSDEWLASHGKPHHAHLVKTGSYKLYDRYSRERGFPPNQIGGVVGLVHPKRKETWIVTGIEKGKRLLDMLKYEDKANKTFSAKDIVAELSKV